MSLLLNIAYSKQCCFIRVKPLVLGIITPCENNRHIGTSAPIHTYSASAMRIEDSAVCDVRRSIKKANDLSEKSEVLSLFGRRHRDDDDGSVESGTNHETSQHQYWAITVNKCLNMNFGIFMKNPEIWLSYFWNYEKNLGSKWNSLNLKSKYDSRKHSSSGYRVRSTNPLDFPLYFPQSAWFVQLRTRTRFCFFVFYRCHRGNNI